VGIRLQKPEHRQIDANENTIDFREGQIMTEKPNRLFGKQKIYEYEHEPDILVDHLYMLAILAEDTLLQAGAKPDVDYNYKDIMEFAIKLYIKFDNSA